MKPVISIIMGSKSDWATMQKAAEVLDNFGVAYEKKLFPHTVHRTSCSNMRKKHVAVVSRSSSQVLVALLTCQVWLLPKQPFQSSVCQSNHVLLAVWIRSILSFRCQVVYLSQPWLSVKLVRLTLPSLPFRLLSVEDKAIADALANFAEEQGKIAEESTNELN